MRRREFVKYVCAGSGATLIPSCVKSPDGGQRRGTRVLVVAFDGMDPRIVESMMEQRRLPNFQRLARLGSFRRLTTSTPPHTPVAFSSIISGADPGIHQVFDFIHRDPNPPGSEALRPYFSTADVVAPESDWALSLGNWRLPLSSDKTVLLRRGKPFWDSLSAHGVDSQIYFLPANFPCVPPDGPGRFRSVCGMGTPDLLGSYGEFTLFTSRRRRSSRVGGGRFVYLSMWDNRGQAVLEGPQNFLRSPSQDEPPLSVTVDIIRDPENRVAKIEFSGQVIMLNEGEWSQWLPVDFPTGVPGSTILGAAGAPTFVRGIVRLFMKQVHPRFELYFSPINIDPLAPINSISVPDDLSRTLAQRHGRFHTVGIPEDTKALSHGALTETQFLDQAEAVTEERVKQFHAALDEFQQGCLFFYFGHTDLVQHMFWRDRDPQHPGRNAEQSQQFEHVVQDTYEATDRLVGDALDCLDEEDLLIVLSDHGFTSFRRGFNLNTWLLENNYIRLLNPANQGRTELFGNVDWSATRAYGLGMNGLYVNTKGREKHGIVKPGAQRRVAEEISDKLTQVRDLNGQQVVQSVYAVDQIYPNADQAIAPDLIVGYNDGYRASWGTVLGIMPRDLIEDNLDRWSGTHLIEPDLVPGMLLTNRPVNSDRPHIMDIAPTILAAFGIRQPGHMSGEDLFQ